ncbi:hypothetical protein B0A49_05609, partial [Cryomyces minteri]
MSFRDRQNVSELDEENQPLLAEHTSANRADASGASYGSVTGANPVVSKTDNEDEDNLEDEEDKEVKQQQ